MNNEPVKNTRKRLPLLKVAYGLWALGLLSLAGWISYTYAETDISLLEYVAYEVTFADTLFEQEVKSPPQPAPSQEETPPPQPKHPVSLILSDVGLSTKLSLEAMEKLPTDVAFSVTPYADDLGSLIKKAQEQKRTLLLQIPLKEEQAHFVDPGPLAIDPLSEHKDALLKLIALMPEAGAVYGHLMVDLDPKTQQFTSVLKTANLAWIGTLSEANEKLFKTEGIKYITPDNALHKSTPFRATLAHLNDYGEDKEATAPFVLSLKADSTAGIIKWLGESPVTLKPLSLEAPASVEKQPEPTSSPTKTDPAHDPKPAS